MYFEFEIDLEIELVIQMYFEFVIDLEIEFVIEIEFVDRNVF